MNSEAVFFVNFFSFFTGFMLVTGILVFSYHLMKRLNITKKIKTFSRNSFNKAFPKIEKRRYLKKKLPVFFDTDFVEKFLQDLKKQPDEFLEKAADVYLKFRIEDHQINWHWVEVDRTLSHSLESYYHQKRERNLEAILFYFSPSLIIALDTIEQHIDANVAMDETVFSETMAIFKAFNESIEQQQALLEAADEAEKERIKDLLTVDALAKLRQEKHIIGNFNADLKKIL